MVNAHLEILWTLPSLLRSKNKNLKLLSKSFLRQRELILKNKIHSCAKILYCSKSIPYLFKYKVYSKLSIRKGATPTSSNRKSPQSVLLETSRVVGRENGKIKVQKMGTNLHNLSMTD